MFSSCWGSQRSQPPVAVCCCKTSPSTAASLVFGSSRLMKCRVWTLTSGGGPSDMLHFLPFRCYRADRSREVEPSPPSSSSSVQETEPAKETRPSGRGAFFASRSLFKHLGERWHAHTPGRRRWCCVSGAITLPPPLLLAAGYFYGGHSCGVPVHLHEVKKGQRVACECDSQRGSITSLLTTCSVLLQQAERQGVSSAQTQTGFSFFFFVIVMAWSKLT